MTQPKPARNTPEGINVCAHCDSPAGYLDTRHGHDLEALCEPCATHASAHDTGLALGSLNAMTRPVWTLLSLGYTGAEVLEAVAAIMDGDGDKLDLDPAAMPAWGRGLFEHDHRFVPLGRPA